MTITEKLEALRATFGEADRYAIELRRRWRDVEVWSLMDERLFLPKDSFGLPIQAPRQTRDLRFTKQQIEACDSLKELIESHPAMQADPWPCWALLRLAEADPAALRPVVIVSVVEATEGNSQRLQPVIG